MEKTKIIIKLSKRIKKPVYKVHFYNNNFNKKANKISEKEYILSKLIMIAKMKRPNVK
jgi:hypothetical protein